ncbi:MAG: allophanate hydrolase [Hyphomicrobiaceae bacterium]|nr:MAG: allophanate hydrolase [Hyphomicrobiaceae bacterium]
MTKRDIPIDIRGLHDAYARGLDPVEVVERAFDAIGETGDPGIFISLVDRSVVRKAVQKLGPFDQAAKPLWGVPFAVKDNIDVAGMATTAACPAFAYTPKADADAVERLIAAGAIPIGKTNLDQFATGLAGVRTPYPIPKNAIDATIVPGGSSSGSAVAVARGLVPFALGTDTAGSGRVPAGLNNIVGLKPSVGSVSTRGVVPACATLDCVSVFAGTVDDAWAVYEIMAGWDEDDPFSRPIVLGTLHPAPPLPAIGIPRPKDQNFFGDEAARAAWRASLDILQDRFGAKLVEIDMTPFFDTAALLYEGPWVAERYAAIRTFIETRAGDMHPVTRQIVDKAKAFSAADAFGSIYRLAELRRMTERVWHGISMLAVPTAPCAPTLDEVADDPLGPNSRLGTYTNFVNLLDLAALSVPGPFRKDRRAAGLTFIGPRGSDAVLASFGRAFHAATAAIIGATSRPLPKPAELPSVAPEGFLELAVVGAHLSSMALNHEIKALGGVLLRAVNTEPCYELYVLPGGPPLRPGLVRVAAGKGHAIATEVWALPAAGFGRFVAGIPAPLGVGTLQLADGTRPKGFLCEAEAVRGARNVSSFGSWRAFIAAQA